MKPAKKRERTLKARIRYKKQLSTAGKGAVAREISYLMIGSLEYTVSRAAGKPKG